MYKLHILPLITLTYATIYKNHLVNSQSFINIDKKCKVYPEHNIKSDITILCPDQAKITRNGKDKSEKNREVSVEFKKYYTFDENKEPIDKVVLSNSENKNYSTLSICRDSTSKDCKTINLYLVNPNNPGEGNSENSNEFNNEKESSLIYDIDVTGNNIVKKEYDPHNNLFQVTLDKGKKEEDVFLNLGSNENIVYELDGVKLKNVNVHFLERADGKVDKRKDYVLISHNKLSNKKSFVIIKVKYISGYEINKGKLLNIKIKGSTSKYNEANELNRELLFLENDDEIERRIEMNGEELLLSLNVYGSEIFINNLKITSSDYKFLVVSPTTYKIRHKNKVHSLVITDSSGKKRVDTFTAVLWVITVINTSYSLYKFYLESLNYIIFLIIFSCYLHNFGEHSVIFSWLTRCSLNYVDDKTDNFNTDLSKWFFLLSILYIIVSFFTSLYFIYFWITTYGSKQINKKIKILKRYKMNMLIMFNYLFLVMSLVYIKLYKKVNYVYLFGTKIGSVAVHFLNLVLVIAISISIYCLYPGSIRDQINEFRKFKFADLALRNNFQDNLSCKSSYENEGVNHPLIRPTEPKEKNVIRINRKYQLLYINTVLFESFLVIGYYLIFDKSSLQSTGILWIKFIYWLLVSIHIQRNKMKYDNEKFNKYLLTKSIRYCILTLIITLHMFSKTKYTKIALFIYVNHCINHKITYILTKSYKKFMFVVGQ